MDDTDDDARYPPNPYAMNNQQGYGSSNRQKLPVRGMPYSRAVDNQYINDEDEDDVDDEEDEIELGEEEENNNQTNGSARYVGRDADDDDDEEEAEDHDNDDEYNEDEDGGNPKIYNWKTDDVNLERHPKKRKLKSLVSSYEFAPRVPTPAVAPPVPRPSSGGRNSLTDWNEHETFVLLDAWGDRFLQRGRKSLRSEEWQEVAEKVSEVSKIERTDTQCRNRLDTLKKKYKKEKLRMAETGDTSSKWVYFKKMDMLMSSPPQQGGLSCGLDSGEYVFMNPRAYLNRANGVDEMRDSPANSESTGGEEDDSDGLPPKKRKIGRESDERSSFRLLADSIHKFSEIYEKIENSKRKQMLELEKMRMDFHRDLEMQKRQIMERAQAEIAKIRQGLDDENDVSAENASG
ncbi:Trihelix transcription factor [Melia azedarach]|uniref:Trihelix transcription factor n=1 Tax=Melia azedarach TaxID=155640 RepID=A0ACC1Y372_MELAZ|nr:Trihelix transcription factor [Melia azedarach]